MTLPPIPPNVKGMAVAWFKQSDWPRWMRICPGGFEPSYTHWLSRAEAALADLDRQGTPYQKVVIDPDEFLAWCKETGEDPLQQGTRTKYAVMTAYHRQTVGGLAQERHRMILITGKAANSEAGGLRGGLRWPGYAPLEHDTSTN